MEREIVIGLFQLSMRQGRGGKAGEDEKEEKDEGWELSAKRRTHTLRVVGRKGVLYKNIGFCIITKVFICYFHDSPKTIMSKNRGPLYIKTKGSV